jgi:signal transduction histidine kinase
MRLNPFRRRRGKEHPKRRLLRRGVVALTDPVVDAVAGNQPVVHRWVIRLLLLVAFGVFWIAFGTAGLHYDTDATSQGAMFFVALPVAGPVLFAYTRPLPALLFSVASAFVLVVMLPEAPGSPPWPWPVVHGLVIFALLFATAARRSLAEAAGAWLMVSLLFFWGVPEQAPGWTAGLGALTLTGVLTGRLLRVRRDLRAQTEVSESERARRLVLEERANLARDLHDIVAHHMSLVVVQAETAQYRVPDLQEAARAEMLSISQTARSALTETRALLAVLRQENTEIQDAPQPGLHLLEELVETTRRAGVDVEARITGDLNVLREGRSLAGFRIAQEALANATRHAGGASVRLEAHGDADGVHLAVVNGRPGSVLEPSGDDRFDWGRVGAPTESGHGIIGMRERAGAAGGRLLVGPIPDGYLVQVFLPAEGPG